MGLGNGKYDNGNKGSNFDYELTSLKILERIANAIPAAACCPTDATEATLNQVLGALQNGQTFNQAVVRDTGGVGCPGNCPVYIQIRIFNTTTHLFDPPIYYDADNNLVVPIGPLEFLSPQDVLDNILMQVTNTTNILSTNLDVLLSSRASEATLLLTNTALGTINSTLGVLGTESTLALVKTVVDNIKLDTAYLVPINTTPGFISDSTSIVAQPVPTGVKYFSLTFRGTGGELNGVPVPDGFTIPFGNSKDPIITAMTYLRPIAGTGMEVLISTLS